ncbi:MAG: hypothetical protein ACKO6N_29385 [Myxococcota bacterium]
MAKGKNGGDIEAFHARAVAAAREGLTMKEFAKREKTLANNVSARLYEALLENLPIVMFREPERSSRRRQQAPENISQITLYTGRAKTPYLTLKVPTSIVERIGAKDDYIEWDIVRGKIVGKKVEAPEGGIAPDEDAQA